MRRRELILLAVGLAAMPSAIADPAGAALYDTHCTACHASDGRGDVDTQRILGVDVGDLSVLADANGGEYPYEYVHRVVDGRSGPGPHALSGRPMPAWGRLLQEGDTREARERVAAERVAAIVEYVRTLQGPVGDPQTENDR